MLHPLSRVCPLCQLLPSRTLLRQTPLLHPQQQQSRLYAQIQRERAARYVASPPSRSRSGPARNGRGKPRPARMVLSQNVARPARPLLDGKPTRKKREPFSHLNRTKTTSIPPQKGERRATTSHTTDSRRHDNRRTRADPFHALKMQKSLHDISYGSRSAIKKKIEEVKSFQSLPLLESIQTAIQDALPGLEYRQPTPAQAVAIPALLGVSKRSRTRNPTKKSGPESFLLAAETGSGKTLAYLLPVIDAIKREEARDAEEAARKEAEDAAARDAQRRDDIFSIDSPDVNKATDPARPRAIILVPSAELVAQVGAVAKSLSHAVKFRAAPISAKNSATVIRNRLFNPHGVDLVISTPPLLASIAQSNPNILARVTHLVIDEADSLLDRSFKPSTTDILDRATPSLKQLLLCSATIPKYLDRYLADAFPHMTRLVTPNLHAIPRRVQLGVVDVNKEPYRGNKLLACADAIFQIGRSVAEYDPIDGKQAVPTKRILVFVNEREDTEEVAAYLAKKGIDATAFHRDTSPERQAKVLEAFTGAENPSSAKAAPEETGPAPSSPRADARRQLPNTKVMVTTDLGSRGIDTVNVRHVILYDVPHTTIDFIHRLGRTGRMGRRGRGIVLVGKGDRADVVREVREAMFRGEALI